ncbi:MAG: type II secretion system protein M [Synergistaceae bacterium]|nr:type II secretion system protein M [Synergistaceae bacterium]
MDALIGNIRTVLRGEAAGSVRLVVFGLLALIVWAGVWTVSDWNAQAQTALDSQQGRFRTLLLLADEYKSLSPSASSSSPQNVDVAAVFAQVSENMSLGSRVNRITPDGRNQSVEINRLYADELTELQKQLAERGVRFNAAEIRALPAGKERLFTVSAIIGPVN